MKENETPNVNLVCRIEEARQWMSDHNLLLNETKTEAVIITTPHRKHLQGVSRVSACGCDIVPSPTIRNLGITIDCGNVVTSNVVTSVAHVQICVLQSQCNLRDKTLP